MDEQLWTPIAVALVTKAADTMADGVKTAFTALVNLVRRRFAHKPEAQVALDAAMEMPTDPDRINDLSIALQTAALEDSEFADALRSVWQDLAARIKDHESMTINQIAGQVSGNVVQARDIHGDVSFGTR